MIGDRQLGAAQLAHERVEAIPVALEARRGSWWVLAVPNGVFKLIAGRVVAIDPHARSSMWDDLEAKRSTEIDFIQGEIVALASRLGRQAPVNARLVGLVKDAERGGKRDYTGAELYAALRRP